MAQKIVYRVVGIDHAALSLQIEQRSQILVLPWKYQSDFGVKANASFSWTSLEFARVFAF